ncbi:hypothetical protein [Streptomyces sp. NPDC056160]|uniref:hypothetical protein n=1 Tax=Streptomyces sp. NPDC056160 TaxID=3345731 RepID=UPI0035DB0544
MPAGLHVFPSEQDGSCIWLIHSGSCTRDLVSEWNGMLKRIAGDGLWLQAWSDGKRIPPRHASLAPLGDAANLLLCG